MGIKGNVVSEILSLYCQNNTGKSEKTNLVNRRKPCCIPLATGSSDPSWVTPFHVIFQLLHALRMHYQGEVN